MPWDADLEKEGHGELYVLTEDEALRLEKRGIPILTGLQTMDLEQSSLNRILNGGICELSGIDRNGNRVLIGAKPDNFERGFFFDEDFSDAVETCLDIGSQALDCNGSGKNTFCKIGRQQTAKTVEVDAMLREAPAALEHVRGALDDVASQLGARTTAASTRGVEGLSVSRMFKKWSGTGPRPTSLGFHLDYFPGDGRLVWGSRPTEVCFGLCSYSKSGAPMPNGTHGKPNPVDDMVGWRCATVVSLRAREVYYLSRAGSGNEIVFIELRILPDGTKLYIPYKRAHAVLGVEDDQNNAVATLGRTGKTQDQLARDVKALLRPAPPASTPTPLARPLAPALAPPARGAVGGFGGARPSCNGGGCDAACQHPGSGGGGRGGFNILTHWSARSCIVCAAMAKSGEARPPPKKAARRGGAAHAHVQGTEKTHVSYAYYGPQGASVPTMCGEHKSIDDVLIVATCGEEGCTKRVVFTRSADATCGGAYAYCPEHGKDRKGYYRWASARCHGGDGECSKEAVHRRVAGADGKGPAQLCPEHLAALGGAAQKQYARSSNGCDNCSSGQRAYERRNGEDGWLCPACHDALTTTEREKWWRLPSLRCGDGTCDAVATCPRSDGAPSNLKARRLCPAHVKDLPPDARKFYKPPPKKPTCDRCGTTAAFFGDGLEPKLRCANHALITRLSTRKRASCGGLKRGPSYQCGDGTCGGNGAQGVRMKENHKSRLCKTCGTEKVGKFKEAIADYEFIDKKKRDAAAKRAAARL